MPIGQGFGTNLKVNTMMGGPTAAAGNDGGHHRDMSLDDDRGNRR